MTDRSNTIFFVKIDAQFFYCSNISRQEDAGDHSLNTDNISFSHLSAVLVWDIQDILLIFL